MHVLAASFRAIPIVALMMEAASTSGMSVNFYQTTRRYNPEDSHLSDNFYQTLPTEH
jgi:hypothetical protein